MISLLKNNNILLIILIFSTLLISCNSKKSEENQLLVTIEPQRYFLEQIVGGNFKVSSLVPSGANPESFDPAPSQMIALSNSEAYFKIGFFGIENTLIDKIKDEAKLKIVDCSNGITIIEGCDHEHHAEHDHGHHHGGHAGGDPHYWSSISSAKAIINNMLEAVCQIDEQNKELYTTNYQKEIARINHTDSIIQSLLDQSSSKAFVIYHPALSYFAQEYNLEQLSIEQDGKSPSPNQLKILIEEAIAKNVKVVFMQQEFDTKNAEIVAEQIGAKIYTINPLSYDWHDEMIKIASYIAGEDINE